MFGVELWLVDVDGAWVVVVVRFDGLRVVVVVVDGDAGIGKRNVVSS